MFKKKMIDSLLALALGAVHTNNAYGRSTKTLSCLKVFENDLSVNKWKRVFSRMDTG